MNDSEALQMMQRCISELKLLRAQVAGMAPLAEAYGVIRDIVALQRRGGVETMGLDLVWTLEKRIREIEAAQVPAKPVGEG